MSLARSKTEAQSRRSPGSWSRAAQLAAGHRGRSRGHVQLRQRIGDVAVDGVLADEEPLGDRLIAQPARNQPQHFQFAGGQAAGVARHGARAAGHVQAAMSDARAPRRPPPARVWRRGGSAPSSARSTSANAASVRPSRSSTRREIDAGVRGFERRPALLEQIDRVFELAPRDVEVAGRRATRVRRPGLPTRAAARCSRRSAMLRSSSSAARARSRSPSCPGAACARISSSSAAARSVRFFAGSRRRCRSASSTALCAIAAIERDRGASQRGDRMSAAAIEERRRFVEASLAPPQLAEPRQAVGRHARPADGQLVAGVRQLAFRLVPRAAPHADRRVLRPAHGEERLQPPLPAVFLDAVAPLDGAAVIADAIAGADQIAAGERDQQAVGQLAGENRRADLVELAQSLGDAPRRDERESVAARVRPSRSRSRRSPARCGWLRRASASAASGSPSSSSAKTAARAARNACSGESGCPSSSRRARWSQPLATPSSPRNAALSQAIQTATRAAETLIAAAAIGADTRARANRTRRPRDRATTPPGRDLRAPRAFPRPSAVVRRPAAPAARPRLRGPCVRPSDRRPTEKGRTWRDYIGACHRASVPRNYPLAATPGSLFKEGVTW